MKYSIHILKRYLQTIIAIDNISEENGRRIYRWLRVNGTPHTSDLRGLERNDLKGTKYTATAITSYVC